MSYDAGAAVGRLIIDTNAWKAGLLTAGKQLDAFAKYARSRLVVNATTPVRETVAEQAKISAATRVADLAAAKIAAKQSAAISLVNAKSVARQQQMIAVDAARTQNRMTLMEARNGYKMAAREATAASRSHVTAFDRVQRAGTTAFNSIGTAMTRVRYGAQLVATTFVAVAAVIGWLLHKLIGGFAEFEQRMRKATSVTKYTEDQFRSMTREAETAAKRWGTPARDAADAFLYLGRAGLTAEQQLQAMPAVTAAAKAMLEDLEETTEGTINVMNSFDIKFDQTAHVVDMMTEAVNSSTMNLHEFLVSLSYVGKPAKAFNNTIQDTAAMIGLAANAGIRGSKAGTALRFALTALASPTREARTLLRELHINVYDSTGAMKPLVELIDDLSRSLEGAGEEMRNYAIETLFGRRALPVMIALFEKGARGIKAYSDQIKNAGNVTEMTANKQMLAMKSQLERLRETWEALRRHVVQTFSRDIMRAISVVIAHVEKWTEAVEANRDAVRGYFVEMVGHLVDFVKIVAGGAAFALVVRVLGGLLMIVQALASPLGIVIALLLTLQVAWEHNFLGIRDFTHDVFEFMKNDVVDFFSTLINGAVTAVSFVLNQFARLGQRMNIGGMASATVRELTIMPPTLQNRFKPLLGNNPEAELRRLMTLDLRFYNQMNEYQKKIQAGQMSGFTENFDLFEQQIKNAQEAISTNTATAAVRDLYGFKAGTQALKEEVSGIWNAFGETFKKNIDFVAGYMGRALPSGMFDALNRLLNDIRNSKDMPELDTAKRWSRLGKPFAMGAPTFPFTSSAKNFKYTNDFWLRFKDVSGDVAAQFAINWEFAIKDVMNNFKTMEAGMVEGLTNIRNDMGDAFDTLMRRGSSLVTFMDSVFQSILDNFRRLIAEMLANSMFDAMLGNKEGRSSTGGRNASNTNWLLNAAGAVFNWDWGKNYGKGGYTSTIGATEDYGIESEGFGSPKMVPTVINITNNGRPVNLTQAASPEFDGRQLVLNYVMEEAVSNPRFGEIIRGGAY